ncbi:uncharacterized protein JCM6883_002896 [Sporobolomyces salmoneus]|uniref:uncharacterized protein n=1 Tax=Sporobolomyces salmoneus TaxID=183962 RepID=UPI0031741DE2
MDGYLDLGALADYTKLVNLQIYGYAFHFTVSRPFTSLQSFTLIGGASSSVVARMLNPENLPSLRALGLQGSRVTLPDIDGTEFPRLFPQLDAICLDSNFYLLTKDNLLSEYSPRILVDVPPNDLIGFNSIQSFGSIHHLRIKDHGSWRSEAPRRISNFIAAAGEVQSSSLKSIYLDLSFHPSEFTSKSQG